jgi:predicted DCC family thiol-disulfide oxidoreductase YuxK
MNMTHRPTLLYSGGCKFCRWVVRTIVTRLDVTRVLDVLPLRDRYAWLVLLKDIPEERRNKNWWFIDAHGRLWAGNQGGGLALLSTLPLTMIVGRLGLLLRLSPLVDRLDDWVKRKRPVFSRHIQDGPMVYRLDGEDFKPIYGWQVAPAHELDPMAYIDHTGQLITKGQVDGLALNYHD